MADAADSQDAPLQRGVWRHYKGNLYRVLDEATHSETLEPMVVYQALSGSRGLWVRPRAMFLEAVAADGRELPRFAYVGDGPDPAAGGCGDAPRRLPPTAALLIIDVQRAIDDPVWAACGPRNHAGAEEKMAAILAAWRQAGRPAIHIRHESAEPGSTYRPGQAGSEFKACVRPAAGEAVVAKHVNSAFIGTGLESRLRSLGVDTLVVFGVITNNSVEATVRMAGNLGFAAYLVEDACFTFARPDYHGRRRSAAEVHAMSLANLDGEYCRVLTAAELMPLI